MQDQSEHDLAPRASLEALHVFSGIDGATGEYLRPPTGSRRPRRCGARRGAGCEVDRARLDEAGWGVVLGSDVTGEQREALRPLLDLRRAQAGGLYREIDWVRADDSARRFLERFSVVSGPHDPRRMPYYVLLVGQPGDLPFRFQHSLDVPCAVGRLAFDTADEYARYADAVVAHEKGGALDQARALVFAPQHDNDHATSVATSKLAEPLVRALSSIRDSRWTLRAQLGQDATQRRLLRALGGDQTPQVLFFIGHGLAFFPDDPRQAALQGAMVAAEWPGRTRENRPRRAPREGEYVSADHIRSASSLRGAVVFSVSCFSAGTPELDSYERWISGHSVRRADRPFVAPLAQRLLGRHGALAVVGHVDAALLDGFLWPGVGGHTRTFEMAARELMAGHTVGMAMESFTLRYMHLRVLLGEALESNDAWPSSAAPLPAPVPVRPLSADEGALWVAGNDARGYVVLGDPAVRINVAQPPARKRVLRGFSPRGEPPEGGDGGAVELDSGA